jgi:hypothetical protein
MGKSVASNSYFKSNKGVGGLQAQDNGSVNVVMLLTSFILKQLLWPGASITGTVPWGCTTVFEVLKWICEPCTRSRAFDRLLRESISSVFLPLQSSTFFF